MVTLRATRPLLRQLAGPAPSARTRSVPTALGDWFATDTTIGGQRLILIVSTATLLPVVLSARELPGLPDRLPELVGRRLRRLGVAEQAVRSEVAAMGHVQVGPTNDRAVLGVLVHLARELPDYMPKDGWDATTLPWVERMLADTPRFRSSRIHETVLPSDAARLLMERRWRA